LSLKTIKIFSKNETVSIRPDEKSSDLEEFVDGSNDECKLECKFKVLSE
jgi:hypothetical protein